MSSDQPLFEKAKAIFGLTSRKRTNGIPNRAEFQRMTDDLESTLISAARRMCQGDPECAQDLVQDTLIRAYQAYMDGRFEVGTNAKAWLLRIQTNCYINEYRRRQRWGSPVEIDSLGNGADSLNAATRASDADVPGAVLISNTVDEHLERALDGLSTGIRLCILLVDVEGLDYAEAAAALKIPVGTVRSRLSRGRAQLYKALASVAREKGWA